MAYPFIDPDRGLISQIAPNILETDVGAKVLIYASCANPLPITIVAVLCSSHGERMVAYLTSDQSIRKKIWQHLY
jgi:hypothetical protein